MAWRTVTDWDTSEAELHSSIYETTKLISSFLYRILNGWIMPRSSGLSRDVVLSGRNPMLMLLYASCKSSGWHPGLFMNRTTERDFDHNFLLIYWSTVSKISPVIYVFFWLKYSTGNSSLFTEHKNIWSSLISKWQLLVLSRQLHSQSCHLPPLRTSGRVFCQEILVKSIQFVPSRIPQYLCSLNQIHPTQPLP